MKQITKKQGGFTLIEVVLVLAIGALIILMALLAFGGASRSRRDTARANLAGQIQAGVEQSAANTGGAYPDETAFNALKGQYKWVDPGSGTVVWGTGTPTGIGVVYVQGGTCTDGTTFGTDTASTTTYAVVYRQENGNATVCKSN